MKRRGPFGEPLLRDLIGFARGRVAVTGALVVLGSLLEMAGILMLVPVVRILLADEAGPGGLLTDILTGLGLMTPRARIAAVLAVFALIIALRFAVLHARDIAVARLRGDFVTEVRARAFRALAAAPWGDLVARRHGRIGHALARDVDRVSDSVGMAIFGALAVVQLVVQLGLALALAPLITLGVVLLGAGAFRGLRGLRRRARQRGEALTEADYALFETTATYLRGLKPARAHGLEGRYAAAFETAARRVAAEIVRQSRDHSLAGLAMQSLAGAVGLAAIAAGVFLVPTGPAILVSVLLVLARLGAPLQAIQAAGQQIGHAAAAYRSLCRLTGEVGRLAPPASAPAEPLARPPAIRFRDVGFASAEAAILAGIDCEIEAGRVTALTGPSGAGKSLFCDIAVGLLAPETGRVELDGAPLDAALTARLARSLAYVAQEPFLIEDSLRANLIWGCDGVTDHAIWRALDAVGAAGLARGLDGGLDGWMRSGGSRFSGGERQRFRLANALLRRARLVVLDEATNALDAESERAVLAGFRRAAPEATMLIVTHRPASLAGIADRLIVIENGRLAFAGTPSGAARRRQKAAQD